MLTSVYLTKPIIGVENLFKTGYRFTGLLKNILYKEITLCSTYRNIANVMQSQHLIAYFRDLNESMNIIYTVCFIKKFLIKHRKENIPYSNHHHSSVFSAS